MSTPVKAEVVHALREQLSQGRRTSRQLSFVTGKPYWGIEACLRGMRERGEVGRSKARPGVASKWWLK